MNITAHGRHYLGAAIGSSDFVKFLAKSTMSGTCNCQTWLKLQWLSPKLCMQPSYMVLSTNSSRTNPGIDQLSEPVEETIRTCLIPAWTGSGAPNNEERSLLALPVRLGGLGVPNPTCLASLEYSSSVKISAALTQSIIDQQPEYTYVIYTDQCQAKETVQCERCKESTMSAKTLKACTSSTLQRAMKLAQAKGSSSLLLALPLQEYGLTPYIKALSGMHSPSDTDGHLPTYQPTVPAELHVACQLSMLSPA